MLYSAIALVDLVARVLVVIVAGVFASTVALTHWAVRSRRLTPFGAWPRFVRRVSDPVLLPLERRIIRAGGSPQDAPLWLVGIVIAGGLLLLSLISWLQRIRRHSARAGAGGAAGLGLFPRLSGLFTVLMVALFVRVIASWFGISPYRPWMRPVMLLTDWIIEPIRRILPPLGMIDFSPLGGLAGAELPCSGSCCRWCDRSDADRRPAPGAGAAACLAHRARRAVHGDALKVRLAAAPPVEGAANEALIRFLAERLEVPRSAVRLEAGLAGRSKVVSGTGSVSGGRPATRPLTRDGSRCSIWGRTTESWRFALLAATLNNR